MGTVPFDLTNKILLIKGDFFQHDFADYTVIFINDPTDDRLALEQKLAEEMKPDAILLSHGEAGMITDPRFILLKNFSEYELEVFRKK